jgi:ribosomal protein L7/L12
MTVNFNYNGKNMLRLVRELSDSALVDVALRIAETDPVVFARAVLGETRYTCSIFGTPVDLQYLQGMKSNDKVRAIKWLREKFNIGLKEAKDLVEKLAGDKVIDQPSWVPFGYSQSYMTKGFEEIDIPDDDIPF